MTTHQDIPAGAREVKLPEPLTHSCAADTPVIRVTPALVPGLVSDRVELEHTLAPGADLAFHVTLGWLPVGAPVPRDSLREAPVRAGIATEPVPDDRWLWRVRRRLEIANCRYQLVMGRKVPDVVLADTKAAPVEIGPGVYLAWGGFALKVDDRVHELHAWRARLLNVLVDAAGRRERVDPTTLELPSSERMAADLDLWFNDRLRIHRRGDSWALVTIPPLPEGARRIPPAAVRRLRKVNPDLVEIWSLRSGAPGAANYIVAHAPGCDVELVHVRLWAGGSAPTTSDAGDQRRITIECKRSAWGKGLERALEGL